MVWRLTRRSSACCAYGCGDSLGSGEASEHKARKGWKKSLGWCFQTHPRRTVRINGKPWKTKIVPRFCNWIVQIRSNQLVGCFVINYPMSPWKPCLTFKTTNHPRCCFEPRYYCCLCHRFLLQIPRWSVLHSFTRYPCSILQLGLRASNSVLWPLVTGCNRHILWISTLYHPHHSWNPTGNQADATDVGWSARHLMWDWRLHLLRIFWMRVNCAQGKFWRTRPQWLAPVATRSFDKAVLPIAGGNWRLIGVTYIILILRSTLEDVSSEPIFLDQTMSSSLIGCNMMQL